MFADALERLLPTHRHPSMPRLRRGEIRAAVVELRSRGMSLDDISTALGIHPSEVARLVTEPAT